MIDINIVKLKKYAQECSVLYVEDDELIREQTASFLGRFFTDIVTANDGALGFLEYKKRSFDIVITDINMPNMDGIEMIEAIKEIDYEQIVLVTSAHNDSEYLMRLINLDVMRFILKPFNNKQFLYIIYKIAQELSKHKEKERLEEEVQQILARSQTIVDELSIGIIVIKDNIIDMANKAFLDIGGFDSYETLQLEMPDIGILFEECSGCVSASTNEELIKELQNLRDEDKKVRIIHHGKTIEYQVSVSKIFEEENSYILTFSDITAIHNSLYSDRNTKLPNKRFILEKIDIIKQSVSTIHLIFMTIEHFVSVEKYYGKDKADEIEYSFAESIKVVKDIQMPQAFVGYFGTNKFVIISQEKNINNLLSMLQEIDISSFGLLEKHNDSEIDFHVSPNVILEEIDSNETLQNIELFIDNTFNNIVI